MTSRREEYSSSNVVRSLHPSRPLSPPSKNNSEFDNNLDGLLDDLQTTVNKTAQHLNASKSRDVQYLSPSNTTTVVQERSVSPTGEKVYKSARYQYSSSKTTSDSAPRNIEVQRTIDTKTNVNQLDNLLEDLKQERDHKPDREINTSNIGIDPGLLEPNAKVVKTIRTTTTTTRGSGKPTVNRELNFDSPSLVSSLTHETRTRSRSPNPNYQKHVESQITRDVNYDSEPVLDTSPTSTSKRSYNYSRTTERKTTGVPTPTPTYTTDIVEVDSTDLPAELKNLPISTDLLPGPGTKVTTTVKTYTYEIPNDTKVPVNQNFNYKNEYYNTLNSTSTTSSTYPERDIPPVEKPGSPPGSETYIYRKHTQNTINRNVSPVPRYPQPTPGTNQTYIYKKEVNETTNDVYGPPGGPVRPISPQPPAVNTYIYERDVTNTNRNVQHPPPPAVNTYIYERDVTNRNVQHPPGGIPSYPTPNGTLPPSQPGVTSKYFYKKETNTTNTYGSPPSDDYSPRIERYPPVSPEPYRSPPTEPATTTLYKYSSTTTNTTRGGHPVDKEPLLAPPFPTEGIVPVSQVDGPPKNLDKLLDTLGDTNGRVPDEEPYTPRKEVNTALASNKNVAIVEPKAPTKNIAGPPVYYPPGKELFQKSEAQAAWRAGGGYAKGKGNYEYEAESKSKKSSKSGAAVVPVCLPLCCALPCSIM